MWPTNVDREHFRRVMEVASADQLREEYGRRSGVVSVGNAIADAYLYFSSVIAEWLGSGEDATWTTV